MNILITLDKNYLPPLKTMLISLFINHPGDSFDIYLASDDLTEDDLGDVSKLCKRFNSTLHLIHVEEEWFADAPTLRYYSHAMYYRLLAAQLLPKDMDRILYLDLDMLIINSIRPLYETELGDFLHAACIHKGLMNISNPVNKIRLSTYETEGYYNSGMLLMNLTRLREEVRADDIFDYVKKNRQLLLLPDQDILNGLYGEHILPVDEIL